MQLIINPGSGPVEHATQSNADTNMEIFSCDVKESHGYEHVEFLTLNTVEEGRYLYRLNAVIDGSEYVFEVEMPGLPVEQVRWMKEPGQNIWDFPRLYVGGNSWVWFFAIDQCAPEDAEED